MSQINENYKQVLAAKLTNIDMENLMENDPEEMESLKQEVKVGSPAEKSDEETQENNESSLQQQIEQMSLHQQMEQEILDKVLKSYRKARPYGERKPITKKEKQKKKAKRRMVKKSKR